MGKRFSLDVAFSVLQVISLALPWPAVMVRLMV
jgi:hypothetical protein